MKSFPNKQYEIVYLDPPWSYRDKARSGKRGVAYKYDTLSIEELKLLPIPDILADQAFLFMWVTFPLLPDIWELFPAWGLQYKTCAFVWVKRNKIKDSLFWGMGNYTRANAEICLLATKGKPKRERANVHSVIESKIREHSRKPDEVRTRIVELCGDVPRIELFARPTSDVSYNGWDVWGNEVLE